MLLKKIIQDYSRIIKINNNLYWKYYHRLPPSKVGSIVLYNSNLPIELIKYIEEFSKEKKSHSYTHSHSYKREIDEIEFLIYPKFLPISL